MKILSVENLKKYYGQQMGVEDVSFSIKKGEILGFIGPNGAGKSTTIRCILNLLYPTKGKIKVFGLDSIKDKVEIASKVGYLPSEVSYYDNMKVLDLLEYSGGFYPGVTKDKMNQLIKQMDLDVTRKIEDLSLGNKKKVGIVQGLLHSPELIILDEPTSGLDPLMQQTFFDILEEENKRGATILFSSHILSEVKRLSDRIVFIKDGLIEDMDHLISTQDYNYKVVHLESEHEIESHHLQFRERLGHTSSFLYRGTATDLIKILSTLEFSNVLIEDPSLEEIFLHYYKRQPYE